MRPGTKDGAAPPRRDAADEYRSKTAHEAALTARSMREAGHAAPLGDPSSGIVLVVEQPAGPRVLDALARSLEATGLPDAYVTYGDTGLLLRELLSAEPSALVAVGPGAAREIDALDYPLAQRSFAGAPEGAWFSWTKGVSGLLLPSLQKALGDEGAKRRFWRAFLALRDLASPPP